MELEAIYKRVIGLDIHQAQVTACALIEQPDGTTRAERRQFGAFRRDRQALAQWVAALSPDEVVMESTGIYWKSPYAALEAVGSHCSQTEKTRTSTSPSQKAGSA